MNRIGQDADPAVKTAIDRVRRASRAAGIPTGIFAPSVAAARDHGAAGDTLLAAGIDIGMLSDAAAGMIAAMS